MKFWKASLAFAALFVMYFCSLAASASWKQRAEELQVLNQVNHEEIDMLQSKVKELNAELRIKEKKIVEMESQPK